MARLIERIPRLADRLVLGGLRLRGYRSEHIATSAGRVHVLSAPGHGAGPPLVVLHGLSAAAQYYGSVMRRMRPHVSRVIAPDLLGHGHSGLPAHGMREASLRQGLEEALSRMLDEPAVFFGNSLGAAAAVRYAARHPEKVRALVLVAPGGAAMTREELAAFVDAFKLHRHDRALDFVDKLFSHRHRQRHLFALGVRHAFGRPSVAEFLQNVTAEDLLRPDELSALRMPVRLVWGEGDRVLWPTHLEFFRRHLPTHAVIEEVPAYGHTPHICHPVCLSERVREVVEQAGTETRAHLPVRRPLRRRPLKRRPREQQSIGPRPREQQSIGPRPREQQSIGPRQALRTLARR